MADNEVLEPFEVQECSTTSLFKRLFRFSLDMDINTEELCRFLLKAKTNTYASGNEGTTLKDGSKELIFTEGSLSYRDKYFGSIQFLGEEVVSCEGKCVWGMNYYGQVLSSEGVSEQKVGAFLKEALKRVKPEKPFRGPYKYEENSFMYLNDVEGDVRKFSGTEKILYEGKEVYTLLYHCGLTKEAT